MKERLAAIDARMRKQRFGILLGVLVAILFVVPVITGEFEVAPRYRSFVSVLLVFCLYALARRPVILWTGAALAIPPIAGDILWRGLGVDAAAPVHLAGAMVFLAYSALVALSEVLRDQEVTTDTILGGIYVYLAIGVTFVHAYALVETTMPGSFPAEALGGEGAEAAFGHVASFVYYSFVTLTTLGYGDISPISDSARNLAIIEAVLGQVYLTVFVARLVGLHIAAAQAGEK